ncbi:MAG: sigma-54-dependent Fis family transcriptional regulator [Verrucomicrobia bacterium]|nr:sigma-54-dependent Fis family transcriptional regulator [Verrucomicrobiota bacterium]
MSPVTSTRLVTPLHSEGPKAVNSEGGRILIVDDEREICELISSLLEEEGMVPLVAYDGHTALQKIRAESPEALILDLRLPDLDGMEVLRQAKDLDADLPVVILTAFAKVHGAVAAMRAAAFDYLAKPYDHRELVRVVRRALAERELNRTLKPLSSGSNATGQLTEIMGPSEAIGRLIADLNRVAKSNFSVVIVGETGSGKEVVAQAIHRASPRAQRPFVAVDCGAIPEALLEAELFGHEKGAFTGAASRKLGRFEQANGGTLLLDEILNMPLSAQAKVLRALQERTVCRVGGTQPVKIDVRVLAASNQEMEAAAALGRFRVDLCFRLNEFMLRIPPLRQRKEDIVYLAKRFLDLTNQELHKKLRGFSEPAIQALLHYPWPGNVRQLRSTIRRAVLLADEVVAENHLDICQENRAAFPRWASPARVQAASTTGLSLKEIVAESTVSVEREVLVQTLRQTGGNKAKAARLLRIDYKTIHSKVKKYGLSPHSEAL